MFNGGGLVVRVEIGVEGQVVVDSDGQVGDILLGVPDVHVSAFGDAGSDALGGELEYGGFVVVRLAIGVQGHELIWPSCGDGIVKCVGTKWVVRVVGSIVSC